MDVSYDTMRSFLSVVLMLGATASMLLFIRLRKLPHGRGVLVRRNYLALVVFSSLLASSMVFARSELIGAISLSSTGIAFLVVAIMGLWSHVSLRRKLDGARVEPVHVSGRVRLFIIVFCGLIPFLIGFTEFAVIERGLESFVLPFIIGCAVINLLEYCWVVSLESKLGEPLVERRLQEGSAEVVE